MRDRQEKSSLLGMRTIKSALAVLLSALFLKYVMHQTPFFACIGAIVAVESDIQSSIKAMLIRNTGTIIGGLIGIAVGSFTDSVVIYAIGVIPLIIISNLLKRHESIVPGAIVYFAVAFLNNADQAWVYGLNRILGTFIGSIIGFAVNCLVFPPPKKVEAEQSSGQ